MKKVILFSLALLCMAIFCVVMANVPISVIEDKGLYIINLPDNTLLEPFFAKEVTTNKKVFKETVYHGRMQS